VPAAQDELDPLIGRIALQRGLLDQAKLLEALRECGASTETRLTDILLQRGYVQQDAITAITRDLGPLLARSGDWEHVREEDIKLAKTLITRKVLTEEAAKGALKSQALEARQDPRMIPRLAVILIRDNVLDFETLKPFLHAELTVELVCPQCGVGYMIPQTGADRKWTCRRCKGLLARKQGASVHVKDDTLPSDVRSAMTDEKRKFGKFWLLSELGRGGMGVVYKAYEPALRRYVAIKVLIGKTGPEEVARFYREAQVAAKLKHPNIMQIYEVSKTGDRHFIAMEYIDGHSLGGQKTPPRRAAEIVRDAALAADAAHRDGVVHRDIKPSNLMLDGRGKVFVMDFGLAKSLARESKLTTAGTIVGTPSYMSPEQAQGKLVDKVSDTYSLGAVLYELLTARPPFHAANPVETLNRVLNTEPDPPSKTVMGLSRDLEAIVLKALEKDRGRRYPSAKALADDLDHFLNGEAVSAKPRGAADRFARSLKKKLPILLGLGAAVIVAVVAVVFVLGSGRRDRAEEMMRDGDAAARTGDYQRAVVAYGKAQELDPDLPGLADKFDKARKHIDEEKRKAEEAKRKAEDESRKVRDAQEKRLQATTDLNAGEQQLHEAERDLYRAGADLSRMADIARAAIQRFNTALEKSPGFPEALVARGRAWILLFEAEKAEADFTEAIKFNDRQAAAYRERGALLLQRYLQEVSSGSQEITYTNEVLKPLGRRAVADFTKAADLEGEADRDFLDAGIAFAEGRYDKVESGLTKAIDAGRGKEHHFYLRGHNRYSLAKNMPPGQGRLDAAKAALDDLDQALRQRPNFVDALYMRAAVKFDFFDRTAALADFQGAVRINPRDAHAWLGLGLYHQKMGDHVQALDAFTRGIQADPKSFKCYTSRATSKFARAEFSQALEDCDQALKFNPRYIDALLTRAALYSKLKRDPEALAELDAVIRDFPERADILANRGRVQYRLSHWRECVADLERALLLGYPDNDTPSLRTIIEDARKRIK